MALWLGVQGSVCGFRVLGDSQSLGSGVGLSDPPAPAAAGRGLDLAVCVKIFTSRKLKITSSSKLKIAWRSS